MQNTDTLRIIDLFAGIGGIRLGFEQAAREMGYDTECVFTSEIKPHAREVLAQNHPGEEIAGDITKVDVADVPDFDFLLAGFPCQAFSMAGKRLGFADTRGTLFFDVERILKAKRPKGFVLENVEGLVIHDKANRTDPIGRTLTTILQHLDALGYHVSWKVLNASEFGVAQNRRRIYIVGTSKETPRLDGFATAKATVGDVLETGLPTADTDFVRNLLAHYSANDLHGKTIKDKRGGADNIHSWDIEYKGAVSGDQKAILDRMATERRKKKYAAEYGIKWMDGMPLTARMVSDLFPQHTLEETTEMLDDLVTKGYLVMEHPKQLVDGVRMQDDSLPKGYNIVTGKLSFEVGMVLDPDSVVPTLVATDMNRIYVTDGDGIRRLTLREGLRLFGYPDDYEFTVATRKGYDLLGNTVVVPVIKAVSERTIAAGL